MMNLSVSNKTYYKSFFFGILAGLAFSPFFFVFFIPISFSYIINLVLQQTTKKKVLIYSSLFAFGYYLIQLYWISFSLLIDKKFLWLIPFSVSIIPMICSIFVILSLYLLYIIVLKSNIKNKFIISIIFAFLYVFFEFLRGTFFPWNLFSYIIGFSTTLIQINSIFNIYVTSFIWLILLLFFYVLFDYENKKFFFTRENKNYAYFYVISFCLIFFFGYIRLYHKNEKHFNLSLKLVQANIKQNLKMNVDNYYDNVQKHIDLSKDNENTDIIIWSESSIPFALKKDIILPKNFDILNNKILITGAIRYDEDDKYYNSIFVFKDNKIQYYYDKNILVPFGEFIPFSKYIPFLDKIVGDVFTLSVGSGNFTFDIDNIKISPIICYEIIYPNHIIDKKNKPDIIINLTNDAWFGFSSGPFQHLNYAKFRAVENKLPIVRVSNNGFSAYVNEYGEIKFKSSLNKTQIIDINI